MFILVSVVVSMKVSVYVEVKLVCLQDWNVSEDNVFPIKCMCE